MKGRIEEKLKIYLSATRSLVGIGLCLVLFSCNNSFNVLNRKYQPGYTVNFSNKIKYQINKLKEQDRIPIKSIAEEVIVENDYVEDNSVASLNNSELFINNYKVPDYTMPCDTPPQKSIDEPWSLYKPKETSEEGYSKWKPLEPFNLASFVFILLGIITGAVLTSTVGVWVFFLLFLPIFVFSFISLIRIKKHPKKYSQISKAFDWIFVSIGFAAILAFSIVFTILAATGSL